MSIGPNEIGNLDGYIEQLLTCKPLKESEVKFLCEKVRKDPLTNHRLKKYFRKKVMYRQYAHQ